MSEPNRSELRDTLKKIKSFLLAEKEAGVKEYHLPGWKKGASKVPGSQSTASRNPKKALEELRKKVLRCRGCQLYKTRKNLVFGEGNAKARLFFVGEAPGQDEDLKGSPFVGRAGQLLTRIIEAIGLKREDVYIGNILKCRPPGNRDPSLKEIEACEPWLRMQLEIINPRVICALGKFAAQTLLRTNEPITSLRGKFHDYHRIKLMPTYHPAYLLRNPSDKRAVWEDMKKVREMLKKYH